MLIYIGYENVNLQPHWTLPYERRLHLAVVLQPGPSCTYQILFSPSLLIRLALLLHVHPQHQLDQNYHQVGVILTFHGTPTLLYSGLLGPRPWAHDLSRLIPPILDKLEYCYSYGANHPPLAATSL